MIADGGYRFGNCSVRVYDRTNVDLYGRELLRDMYMGCLSAAPNRPLGILPEAFCGMTDLSCDAISAYLAGRNPVLLMCVDNPLLSTGFDVIGFSFPTIWAGVKQGTVDPDPGRSMFMGYVIFRPYWAQPESVVSMMLTGVYYFHTYNLLSINGQRYPWNHLTAKFLSQFGTRDTGIIPNFIVSGNRVVDCVVSSLARADFETYVTKTIAGCTP